MSKKVVSHRDLEVYQKAFGASMDIFELSKRFPKEETYSLTDQFRRSSRSTCANLAEAWRKRRYEKAFISKLSDAEGEAAETQVWIEFAFRCNYMAREQALRDERKIKHPLIRCSSCHFVILSSLRWDVF